ncbi:MAG TPA: dTDP-4-dehydrorhamnose reductase, partial [Tepidisphaeraceae bacterium]|nr:dTDP-4-dehydrorhamnose reductase [Tepidisphaeraceae bacterium]
CAQSPRRGWKKDKMNPYERVLIVGHLGMLANALRRQLECRGVEFIGAGRDTCDVTNRNQLAKFLVEHRPTLIFNCAAATNVDGCENDPVAAERLNADAVRFLAESAQAGGAKLVHYSTDFVFDGEKASPYTEEDRPNPLSAYGKTKLHGEEYLRSVNPPGYLLLRTAWLYGRPGKCFPRTMVELANKGVDPLKVVGDQRGCPTLTDDLATATLELIDKGASGLFHTTNSGSTNWFEFTRAIMTQWSLPNRVEPLTSAQWKEMRPQSAHRPKSSVLALKKIESVIGRPMRPWRDALADYHRQTEAAGF